MYVGKHSPLIDQLDIVFRVLPAQFVRVGFIVESACKHLYYLKSVSIVVTDFRVISQRLFITELIPVTLHTGVKQVAFVFHCCKTVTLILLA